MVYLKIVLSYFIFIFSIIIATLMTNLGHDINLYDSLPPDELIGNIDNSNWNAEGCRAPPNTEVTSKLDRCIFVGDLSDTCGEFDLQSLFSRFGDIDEIFLKSNRKVNAAYAFIYFKKVESVKKVLDYMGTPLRIHGKLIRVGSTSRNYKLHVGNLSVDVTAQDLNIIFEDIPGFVESETHTHKLITRSASIGEVCFTSKSAAERAISELNGYVLLGRPMLCKYNLVEDPLYVVEWFVNSPSLWYRGSGNDGISRGELNPESQGSNPRLHSSIVSIYVKFEELRSEFDTGDQKIVLVPHKSSANSTTDSTNVSESAFHSQVVKIDERRLMSVFERFGRITVISIKNIVFHPKYNTQCGYAFVHFENSESGRSAARNAVRVCECGYECNGVRYTAELSKNFQKGMESSRISVDRPVRDTPVYQSQPGAFPCPMPEYYPCYPWMMGPMWNPYAYGSYPSSHQEGFVQELWKYYPPQYSCGYYGYPWVSPEANNAYRRDSEYAPSDYHNHCSHPYPCTDTHDMVMMESNFEKSGDSGYFGYPYWYDYDIEYPELNREFPCPNYGSSKSK